MDYCASSTIVVSMWSIRLPNKLGDVSSIIAFAEAEEFKSHRSKRNEKDVDYPNVS